MIDSFRDTWLKDFFKNDARHKKIPTSEIMDHLGLKHREYFRSEILQPMLTEGILAQTMPETPKSPKQKYISLT